MVDLPADVLVQAASAIEHLQDRNVVESSSPFVSRTDELMASLRLGDLAISSSAFNAFLALVRHPDFKPDALTFRSASDVDQRFAEHRRCLARERSYRTVNGPQASTMTMDTHPAQPRLPFDILLNIIDQVSASRSPFESSSSRSSGVTETLSSLSLTHRSLTLPAQRSLSARLISASPIHAAGLAHSPLLNEHTAELTLVLNMAIPRAFHGNAHFSLGTAIPSTLKELATADLELVKRATKLEALKVVSPAFVSESFHYELLKLLRGVGSEAKLLRHLWWTAPDLATARARMDIEEITASCIRELPLLNAVTLRNVRLGWTDSVSMITSEVDGDEHQALPPDINSLSITLVDAALSLSESSISTLTSLFGRGALTSVTLDLTSISSSRTYTSTVIRLLADNTSSSSSLERLRLRIGPTVGFIENHSIREDSVFASIKRLFSNCSQSLRYLQIWVGGVNGVWGNNGGGSGGAGNDGGEGNFTPSAISHASSFLRALLSHVGTVTTLETLHLSFFHLSPLNAVYMSKGIKEHWWALDQDVGRALVAAGRDAGGRDVEGNAGSRMKVVIDTARSAHSSAYEFASVRRACRDLGYALEVRVDSTLSFC